MNWCLLSFQVRVCLNDVCCVGVYVGGYVGGCGLKVEQWQQDTIETSFLVFYS